MSRDDPLPPPSDERRYLTIRVERDLVTELDALGALIVCGTDAVGVKIGRSVVLRRALAVYRAHLEGRSRDDAEP